MSVVMTETPEVTPEERRGGDEGIDWGKVRPGQEFPEPERKPDDRCRLEDDVVDRGIPPLASWCGVPGCGGD